jgi:SNF2 family DNA or RNA helicase
VVRRVLIIAPKKVAEATWQTEAAKWDHLHGLTMATALGTAKERLRAVEADADITIINRENVVWLVNTLGGRWMFDMVVVDESSSFKSPSAQRFKALKRMLPRIRSVVILTGTPAPNGIEDLWSQIYLLDRGERLGRYVTHYRTRYFDHNPWTHQYTAKAGAFEAVQARIADLCVSMKASDYLQLPEMVVHDVPVALDPKAAKAYRELERTMVLPLEGEEEISAMTAAGLTNKLLQLCGGCLYDEGGQAVHVHDAKLEALEELLEGLHGEPALLFYGYKHELPGIEARLRKLGLSYRVLGNAVDAETWNAGRLKVLLAHPASCAYGLNLQRGGRHVIWYTLTWSLELYQQANARLYRQGQEKPVIVHRLLVKGGVDEDVAKALEGKADTQGALIEALKARIERCKE